MRPDQYDKLQALSERLTDVFLDEAEPEKWPGHNIEPGAMDQQTRGDRYWCKKNAVATLSLIGRIADLFQKQRAAGNGSAAAEEDAMLDAEINAAEKEAAKLLDQLQRNLKKTAFDKRVHGKS